MLFSVDPPRIPNIGYLGSCYNIFKGNPFATGGTLDPGFLSAQNIFTFTFDDRLTTTDGRYSIPDHTNVNAIGSCSFAFSSQVTKDIRSYMDSLKRKVETSFSGWGASFSQSYDYNDASDSMRYGENMFISSSAECQAYGASIANIQLTSHFRKSVSNLPATKSRYEYFDFVDVWGTHIATTLIMGGRYGFRSEMSTSMYSELTSRGFSVMAAAGYSGLFSISASYLTEEQKEEMEAFENSRKSYKIFQIGGTPPADEDQSALAWAQTVKDDPLPMAYTLKQLQEYFTPRYFPEDKDIETKRINLAEATVEYCKRYSENNPELCDQEYGPNVGRRIGVRAGSKAVYTCPDSVICRDYDLSVYQHHDNPNMWSFGSLRGKIDRSTGDYIDIPIFMVDSKLAPPEVILPSNEFVVTATYHKRYKCPNGYSTISDTYWNYHPEGDIHPPVLPCIADHCLTQCRKGEEVKHNIWTIGGGRPEFGNTGVIEGNFSFWRDLNIADNTPESELFKCLTYDCLRVLS